MTSGAKGDATREAIRKAAANQFRAHGYSGTTLEEIGETLGISRAAVLYHFSSKQDLLLAVVEPFLTSIEVLAAQYSGAYKKAAAIRRRYLEEFVDAVIEDPFGAGILYRHSASYLDTDLLPRVETQFRQFFEIVAGPDRSTGVHVMASSLLSAILRPLTATVRDPRDPEVRSAVIDVALAILARIDRARGGLR